jgi:hypothetical protein
MIDFKRFFQRALCMVLTRYQETRVVLDERGMRALQSAPPVRSRYILIRGTRTLPQPA